MAADVAAAPAAAPTTATPASSLAQHSAPLFRPALIGTCEHKGGVHDLMREEWNGAMSSISVGLFRMPPGEGSELVVDGTKQLLGCVPDAVRMFRERTSAEEWPAIDAFLNDVQLSALALQTAALEGDVPAMEHWLMHTKQACASCHMRTWKDR